MKLQERLKELRTAHNWTLKELAARSGLSVSYLSDLERGRTVPSLGALEMLASAVEISVIDLLTGVDFAGEATTAALPAGLQELLADAEYGPALTPEWVAMLVDILAPRGDDHEAGLVADGFGPVDHQIHDDLLQLAAIGVDEELLESQLGHLRPVGPLRPLFAKELHCRRLQIGQ